MSGHDRRPKEAAQLGAYHVMLRGRNEGSYFIDARGQRRTLDEPLRMGIVTFCPDASWAMHEVEVEEAEKAYELALAMRHQSKVSTLYKGRAVKSDVDDEFTARLNGELMDAIMRIPADAPELGRLMAEWRAKDLPKCSEGKVPPERYGEAMAMIFRHGAAWQPFPDRPEPDPTCPAERWQRIAQRFFELPVDIREECAAQGAHLPAPSRPLVSVPEAEDWDRLIALAEEKASFRRVEACDLFRRLKALDCAAAVWPLIDGTVTDWTYHQIELYRAIWACCDDGVLVTDGERLVVSAEAAADLAKREGKRAVVALAKRQAENFGLTPSPSKWDDVISSPALYAAVVAA